MRDAILSPVDDGRNILLSILFQNAPFYQNRAILNIAKDLAAKKDISALEELSLNEVCDP